jgi:hypothetical protein
MNEVCVWSIRGTVQEKTEVLGSKKCSRATLFTINPTKTWMIFFWDLTPCSLGHANVIGNYISFTVRWFSEIPPIPIFRLVHKISKSDCRLRYVCLSACLFVRIEQHGSHWADFYEIWYLSIFRKCVQKIQVLLKHDNTLLVHEDQYNLLSYLAGFFLEWEMFHAEVVEKIKTHIL